MKEETIYLCITTPQARTYYKAQSVAKEFLDKDNNVINTTGEIPEGKVTEIATTTATTKHYANGKLHGRLEVRDLASDSITFTEDYNYGQLMDVTDHTSPDLFKQMQQNVTPKATPIYPGTVLKTTKDVRAFYVDGKQIAEETVSANGSTLELLGSIPDGPVKEFFENGKVKAEAVYKSNKLHGLLIRYDEQGQILSKETYEQGVLKGPAEYFSYSQRTTLHTICNYLNALLDGPFTLAQKDGKIREQSTYAKGRLDGPHKTFYPTGAPESEEMFIDGKRQGVRKIFFPSGELWYEENYANGRLEGDRTEYFKNGKIRLTEMYSDGMRNGTCNLYDETGELVSSEEYHWGNVIHNTEYRPS